VVEKIPTTKALQRSIFALFFVLGSELLCSLPCKLPSTRKEEGARSAFMLLSATALVCS